MTMLKVVEILAQSEKSRRTPRSSRFRKLPRRCARVQGKQL